MGVHYEVRGDVAVITVDHPPVNALGPGIPEAIEEAVTRASTDPWVRAVVLIGAGSTFVAGADIRIFSSITSRDQSLERSRAVHARLKRIEDCPKPVVAAIHGTALGGGLELAMACHYRVAVGGARVGQPEVLLGIIPGAGGTQRLPRLAGVRTALEMCTGGHHVPAPRALAAGILDHIVEGDLLAGAIAFARGKPVRRTREMDGRLADRGPALAACGEARVALERTAAGTRAPFAAVEAIQAAVTRSFGDGSEREMELFATCVLSRESRNLVRLFFAEREAGKVPAHTRAPEIRSAAVVGAGAMGSSLALALVSAGIPVLVHDVSQSALDRGLAAVRQGCEMAGTRTNMLMVRPTLHLHDFYEPDLVIEAVSEDPALKKAVFAELGQATRPDAILASTTSAVDLDELARASGRPERVAGYHLLQPAGATRLVEVVRGAATAPEAIAAGLKLAKRLHQIGVVVGNAPGFVANRLLACWQRESTDRFSALANEGARLLDEGVAQRPGDVDVIAVHALGFPRHQGGPLAWADAVGARTVLEAVRDTPSPWLERLAASGATFYGDAVAAAGTNSSSL